MLRFTFLLSAVITALAALGPESTLTIANKNISPDGSNRVASVVNGVHPGPLITANKGDRFKLNVVNELSNPEELRGTSIHWHGILQTGTSMMDGIVGVTQCPIAPKSSFLYSFKADTPGTFWYHSHFGIQYCDGVRGPLIVYDHKDPLRGFYDIDDETTVITLSEWYHQPATTIVGISSADSTLINGVGRFPGGPKTGLAVVNVQSKKRYRLRVISISCDPNFIFSIDNHQLTVIEADGVAAQPHTVDSFQIFVGQRYSVVLQANQPVGNYWIRALPNSGNLNISSTFDNGVNSAILRYKGAPNADPKSVQKKKSTMLADTDLHPLANPKAPGKATPDGADITINLALDLNLTSFQFTINGTSYVPPTVPVLLQILSGARNAHDLLPAGSVIGVAKNKVVQINLPGNLPGGPHPFHLSGHRFSIVRSADTGRFNFLDPIQRDVVPLSQTEGDKVSIRFVTDNPGPWILHCHINFHLNLGLAVVFAEAPEAILPERRCDLTEWETLCPKWDVEPDSVMKPQIPSTSTTAETV